MPGPILLTVFEPFGDSKINASQRVGEEVAAADPRIELLTLPVSRGCADDILLARLESEPRPSLTIALGEAGPDKVVRLEKVAVNYDDFRIPDNAGAQPLDEPILIDGPPAYFATVPVGVVAHSLEGTTPIPVVVSLSAGAFLCNHIAYRGLHHLTSNPICPFLFIHLPRWRPESPYAVSEISDTVTQVIAHIESLLNV